MKDKFPSYSNPPDPDLDREDLIRKLKEAMANTKFKPPIRGWRLFWCRVKWYCYHVPRNLYIQYIGNRFAPK